MEGLREKFVVNFAERTVMVGKIDAGEKKVLHFSANEALTLLALLKKKENTLIRLKEQALPEGDGEHPETLQA